MKTTTTAAVAAAAAAAAVVVVVVVLFIKTLSNATYTVSDKRVKQYNAMQ